MAIGRRGRQGDPSYTRGMVGAAIGRAISNKLDLQLGTGVTIRADQKAKPYFSLGISKLF
ncbi:hypothetical protein VVT58_16915 (plasmid) [Sphingobium sp. SJ10-10]|uniref:hypothetical protein n=1 Tax=Sphingobium sp. SJ10-10 TaxID=3114999 RepID=UPI002E16E547|nr:hypothetical protein [Sphingobium sp. SJ10-10]